MIAAKKVFLYALVSLAITSTLFASEPIPIGTILADPETYHLRIVALRGTVRQVRILEPRDLGDACPGAYKFRLEDETGSIEIGVLGLCGKAVVKPLEVSDGDKIFVEARVHAPGHYTGEGLPILGEDRTTTQAIATKVWRVTN